MKTSYQILWIDDELEFLNEYEIPIRAFLDEHGIKLETIEISQEDTNFEKIESEIDKPDLDIIMIDFSLGGTTGDLVIDNIRKKYQYLPVIFYSGREIEELYAAVSEYKLDGVYIAHRDFLVKKATDVIKSLIKKEQSTKRTRGLLLEGVSEIDARLSRIIVYSWNQINSDCQRQFLDFYHEEKLYPRVNNRFRRNTSFPSNPAEFGRHIRERMHTGWYGTPIRCRIAIKLLQIRGIDQRRIEVLSKLIHDNGQDVSLNSLRNDYAHKTREQLESDHSEERCINIRRMLRSQLENIESIWNT